MTSDEIIRLGLATERLLANDDFVLAFHAVLDGISAGLMNTDFADDAGIKRLMAQKEGVTSALRMLNGYVEAMRSEFASNEAASGAQFGNESEFGDDDVSF